MEFTRLADVEVVETATDVDKVLIEQNGEIKRVPKTEVGGSGGGGNTLVLNMTADMSTGEFTLVSSNMTLDEALTAINNNELTGGICMLDMGVMKACSTMIMFADSTAQVGSACFACMANLGGAEGTIRWTADGIMLDN